MPLIAVRAFLKRAEKDEVLWTYAHPYDFDRSEPFARISGAPLWVSVVLWLARQRAEKKIRAVLNFGVSAPLCERLEKA
jgi:hypothetical protein